MGTFIRTLSSLSAYINPINNNNKKIFKKISSHLKLHICIIKTGSKKDTVGKEMVSLKKVMALVSIMFTLQTSAQTQTIRNAPEEWITIFVHGTLGLRSNFSFATLGQFFRDTIEGTTYEKNVRTIRSNPFVFTMQPIQEVGLKKINAHCSCPCGSYVFALLYNHLLKKYNSGTKNSYYTYGWSGLLSYKQRHKEAGLFYRALREELQKFAAQKRFPKVRLVTYSHGGNLALNLGVIRSTDFPKDRFIIEELSMIGMPVQYANSCLICHPIFKRIFHMYSAGDHVQRLDLFSPSNFLSHKRFHGRLPSKLTQIELRVSAPLLRIPGVTLPANARCNVDQSPGHIELWFFGWTPKNYRRNLALYPLPMATFIPYFIHTATTCWPQERHLCFDIRPHQEKVILSAVCNKTKKTVPFLNACDLTTLQRKAAEFHPGQKKYIDCYMRLQRSVNSDAYQ